jgi:ubiquitin carboxyl-terminal hydrolase 7
MISNYISTKCYFFRRRHVAISLALVSCVVSVHAAAAVNSDNTISYNHQCASAVKLSVGLQNLGNTCYLNSQLQCAYHIPLVQRLILQGPAEVASTSDESTAAAPPESESMALLALRRVFQDMNTAAAANNNNDGRQPVAPRVLCQTLGISVWEQQDSQEFWKLLLPALKLPALTDLYTGAYLDYITALDGSGRERRRAEAFLDLSLDIDRSTTVEASLRQQFGEPELLSVAAGNAWRPEPGAEKVDAHKGSLLLAQGLPPVLQLHLKRFHFDWNTETTTKLNNAFSFPATLDLRNTVEHTEDAVASSCCYELQAVVVHKGEYGSGHYYAYVRPDIRSDEWYRFNDEAVTPVSFPEVIRDAYGGKQPLLATNTYDDVTSAMKQGNFLVRFIRNVFWGQGDNGDDGGYGYGGPKSNAYVLQYVRRCDIPKLYDLAADQ